jgi:hypothetical protein
VIRWATSVGSAKPASRMSVGMRFPKLSDDIALRGRHGAYVAAFALTFLNAVLSLVLVIGLALIFVLPEPRSQPEGSAEDARTTEKRGGD